MKKLTTFGLPIEVNEETNEFHFGSDVTVEKSSGKPVAKMKGLLYDETNIDNDQTLHYVFYNNVMRKEDAHLFKDRRYSNGITVLMPGLVNGECRKNSGHYHEIEEGHTLPYPEAYEILCGEAVFMIQVSKDFHDLSSGLKVDSCQAVFMKAGDKIVVPPFCAHVAVNVGEGIMAFGNLAADTHLNYEPVKQMHGLCY
jgi:oxalate decarboxylase/phosphoglucose isomerase-like protein (cupin superfamily)